MYINVVFVIGGDFVADLHFYFDTIIYLCMHTVGFIRTWGMSSQKDADSLAVILIITFTNKST